MNVQFDLILVKIPQMAIVIRPQGKLDLVGSAALQQKIERVASLTSPNQNIWVIDLEQVNFINHFGLTTLVAARRQAKARNCRLILRNLKNSVRLMLDIAELTDVFEILEQESETNQESNIEEATLTGEISRNIALELDNVELDGEEDPLDTAQAQSISNLERILTDFRSRFYNSTDNDA